MKKMLKVLMIAVLCLALAACGKTEEEKAREEIWGHLEQEAAADGVDLDAMLQKEYSAWQEQKQEFAQQQATVQDERAMLEAMMPEMIQAYNTYTSSRDSKEVIAAAETFNRVHAQMRATSSNPNLIDSVITASIPHTNPIRESIYRGKAALAAASIDPSYTQVMASFYFSEEGSDSKVVFRRTNDAWQEEYLVLLQDGSTRTLDLSAIRAMENLSSYQMAGVTQTSVIVGVIANGDFKNFEFPLDDPDSLGVERPLGVENVGYQEWNLWECSWEELNDYEIRQASREYREY